MKCLSQTSDNFQFKSWFLKFQENTQKEEIWQVLSLNDEIHQDINRKFIIAQDLNNQIMNGQEIERPDTRLAPVQ